MSHHLGRRRQVCFAACLYGPGHGRCCPPAEPTCPGRALCGSVCRNSKDRSCHSTIGSPLSPPPPFCLPSLAQQSCSLSPTPSATAGKPHSPLSAASPSAT